MSTSPELVFRPLELADAPDVYALVRACRAADGEPDETLFDEFVHSTFQLPTADLERDTSGAFLRDGRLVAFGWLFGREGATRAVRLWFLGGVHPDLRRHGIGRRLVGHLQAQAARIMEPLPADLPHLVDVEALPGQAGRLALLASEGFRHVRSFSVMERAIDRTGTDGLAPVPAGIAMTDWRPELDEFARAAHNEAFLDHWGSEPVGPERWRHLGSDAPGFLAGCSSLAVNAAGEVVGYVLVAAPPGRQRERRTAWIGTVGVRREYRRLGVGAALLTRSLAALREAGFERVGLDVDADNPTGAVRLYRRLGFREVRRQLIHSKSL